MIARILSLAIAASMIGCQHIPGFTMEDRVAYARRHAHPEFEWNTAPHPQTEAGRQEIYDLEISERKKRQ